MSSSFLLFLPSFIIAKPENAFIHTFGYTLNYLAAGAMLLFLLTTEIPQIMITRIIALIGYQSYSIYLWHITVNVAMIPIALYFNILPDLTAWPRFIVYFVGSVLWGSLMGKFVEKPFLILREKIAQNPLFLFQSKITWTHINFEYLTTILNTETRLQKSWNDRKTKFTVRYT